MSTPQEAPEPSLTEIVQHFTNAYYMTLYKNIEDLHKFYREDAEVSLAFEDQSLNVSGIEHISQIYTNYFGGCRNVRIFHADGQFSSGRDILLINVHGQIVLLNSDPASFIHTFLLTKVEQLTYSVQNDLFRSYGRGPSPIDGINMDMKANGNIPSEKSSSEVSEAENAANEATSSVAAESENLPTPETEAKLVNGNSHTVAENKVEEKKVSIPQSKAEPKAEVKEKPKKKTKKQQQEKVVPVETKSEVPQPLTYASVVGAILDTSTMDDKPVGSVSSAPAQGKKKTQKNKTKSDNERAEGKTTNTENKTEPKQAKIDKQESTKDKANAIFVNRLPPNTSDSVLRDTFKKFGKIVDINNKTRKSKEDNGQYYAFIFFEDEESMHKALDQNEKIKLGEHYLKIEKRRGDRNKNRNGNRKKNDKEQKSKNVRRRDKKDQAQKF